MKGKRRRMSLKRGRVGVRDGAQGSDWFFVQAGGTLAPSDSPVKMPDALPAEMPRSLSLTSGAKNPKTGWLSGPTLAKVGPAVERKTGTAGVPSRC